MWLLSPRNRSVPHPNSHPLPPSDDAGVEAVGKFFFL